MKNKKHPQRIFSRVKTAQGIFLVEASAKGFYAVRFPGRSKIGRIGHSRPCPVIPAKAGIQTGVNSSGNLRQTASADLSSGGQDGSPMEAFGDDRIKRAAREFAAYFRNPAAKMNLKMDLSGCTPFEKKVYRTLRRVPAGKVLSYGELAKRAGYSGAARAVGNAMKKNRLPIVIPCHRVIPSSGPDTYQFSRSGNWGRPNCHLGRKTKSLDGGIGNYSAGKKWKRWLLEHEKR